MFEHGIHLNVFKAISIDGNVVITGEIVNNFNKAWIEFFFILHM